TLNEGSPLCSWRHPQPAAAVPHKASLSAAWIDPDQKASQRKEETPAHKPDML
ncbi:hypothetical protein E3U43_001522, partial [Larimichthys crocea]